MAATRQKKEWTVCTKQKRENSQPGVKNVGGEKTFSTWPLHWLVSNTSPVWHGTEWSVSADCLGKEQRT